MKMKKRDLGHGIWAKKIIRRPYPEKGYFEYDFEIHYVNVRGKKTIAKHVNMSTLDFNGMLKNVKAYFKERSQRE